MSPSKVRRKARGSKARSRVPQNTLTPREAVDEAIDAGRRIPELERLILSDPGSVCRYAHEVLGHGWIKGEQTVLKDSWAIISWTEKVRRKRRWRAGEAVLLKRKAAEEAAIYATRVLNGKRWRKAEPLIARNPNAAITYATDVIKGKWPAGEKAIRKVPATAETYARRVLKRRWPECEKHLVAAPGTAVLYASDWIRSRWPSLEDSLISKSDDEDAPCWLYDYARLVLRNRLPDSLENILFGIGFKDPNNSYVKSYFSQRDGFGTQPVKARKWIIKTIGRVDVP